MASVAPTDADLVGPAVTALRDARLEWRGRHAGGPGLARLPSRTEVERAVELLSAAMFPVRLGGFDGDPSQEDAFVAECLGPALAAVRAEVAAELGYWQAESAASFERDQPDTIVRLFAATLGDVRRLLDGDVEAAFVGDPAARSADEILIAYPGAIAMLHHRIAHGLFQLGAPIVARVISELANARTGIDIHPGARIGPRFFIDHGTGVVIGETAVIGADVRLYQHVTLGAPSPLGLGHAGPRDRFARHPVVEDDVVIYAGATILGRVTIGRGSVIGGNVWLLDDVPPGSVVVQPGAVRLAAGEADGLSARLMGRAA